MSLSGIAAKLIAGVVLAMQFAEAHASSSAGIEIDLGKFQLKVYYSVAVDYYNDADKVIRDPRSVLFTLSSLLQANSREFSRINHTVQVDLDTHTDAPGNFLSIIEDPQDKTVVLLDEAAGNDIAKKIWSVLCKKYAGACKHPASGKLNLYVCKEAVCPGQVRFGSFPSNTLNRKYGLIKPSGSAEKHLSVSREEIGQYFETLDP